VLLDLRRTALNDPNLKRLQLSMAGIGLQERKRVQLLFCGAVAHNSRLPELILHTPEKKSDTSLTKMITFLETRNAAGTLPFTILGIVLREDMIAPLRRWLGK